MANFSRSTPNDIPSEHYLSNAQYSCLLESCGCECTDRLNHKMEGSTSSKASKASEDLLDDKWIRAIFTSDTALLKTIPKEDLKKKDHRGNTLLMLAILLQNEVLATWLIDELQVEIGDTNNAAGWGVRAEAITLGFGELTKRIIRKEQEEQEAEMRNSRPKIRNVLDELKDFHMEIAWDIHTWVPLVSRALPHDTLRVWKQGRRIRFDSALIDLSEGNMQRQQNVSRIIAIPKALEEDAIMYRVDHDKKEFIKQEFFKADKSPEVCAETEAELSFQTAIARSTPLADFDVLGRDSTLTRAHSGIFGYGGEKVESVGKFECDVYNLSNVQAVTLKRKEHISHQLKTWKVNARKAVENEDCDLKSYLETNPPPLETAHIARRKEMTFTHYMAASEDEYMHWLRSSYKEHRKVKTFNSTLWMSNGFPVSIERIIDILAPLADSSDIVATLIKFLKNKLPPGFPVKLDIPVVPTVSARIVFKEFSFEPFDASMTAIPDDYVQVEVADDEKS